MRIQPAYILALFLLLAAVAGCTKEEEFKTDALSDYLLSQPGKYITYRLDSTVFYPQLGRTQEVHSYQEKHVVDSPFTDNAGRSGYRIFRYLRDVDGTTPWTTAGTYYLILQRNQAEEVENNRRVTKLVLPFRTGNSWKAYSQVADNPFAYAYEFNDDNHIKLSTLWDVQYTGTGETMEVNGKTLADVLTVEGPDIAVNVPVTDPNSFASRTYLLERYAKNIGLVYQEFEMWEYQPNPNPNSTAFRVGFGVKKTMIDHN
ncbi:hypothetical protein V9K67_24090 [Paraflavisolibacter sp. H34]|uniref:hypothetical protein n=1 Tax=Huijunlia imazamoxiresistens TaxID=3127457 RepID=UPI003017044E